MVVMATSRTEEKLAQCTENRAQHVINSKEKNFKEEVMTITDGKGKNKLHFCLILFYGLPLSLLSFSHKVLMLFWILLVVHIGNRILLHWLLMDTWSY